MQLQYVCRRCQQTAVSNSQDAKAIRGSSTGQGKGIDRPVLGYVVLCPHCGTDNLVRPDEVRPSGPS